MKHEQKYTKICEELKKLIEKTGEPLEGNCLYRHHSFNQWDVLLNKRINLQKAAKGKTHIGEIGFNAGHSILTMILVNPKAQYVLFDLGIHTYARPCFEYLKKLFPKTKIEIFWGDSRETVAQYNENYPGVIFDLIHIDGGHTSEIYTVDWKNSLAATNSGSLLIFDDTDNRKINMFIDEEIAKGVVSEVSGFLETTGYEHRILEKN